MQPKGRCQYILDANGAWVPWEGTADGFGGVVLFSPTGIALDTPSGASDGLSTIESLLVSSLSMGYNGTTYDRLRSFAGNADNVTAPTLGLLGTANFLFGFDGTAFDRIRVSGTGADAQAALATGLMDCDAHLRAFNGTSFDRVRLNSAAAMSATEQPFALMQSAPGEWSINHTPAANTQATITRAAGAAGVRHVCKSITATIIGLAASAEATVLVNLRDGATGAGTILWSTRLLVAGTAGTETGVSLSGLNILGSAATAMTLEFAAAGGASTFESVALTGFDTI